MTRIEVVKHYSIGSFRTVSAADARRAEIAKRYPDRNYVITANGRAQSKIRYKVEQVKTIFLDIPDPEKDLGLPEPDRKDPAYAYGFGRSKGFWADHLAWRQHIDGVMKPILAPLHEKMNP